MKEKIEWQNAQQIKISNSTTAILALAIVGIFVCIVSSDIDDSWVGHHDWNGARESIIARNHIRFGYLATRFGPAYATGCRDVNDFWYYIQHPPLISLMVSLSFRIFGIHEWSARLIPITLSVFSVILMLILVRKTWGNLPAILAIFFFAFSPMISYFGRMVNHEPLVLLFVLVTTLFYEKYFETQKPIFLTLMGISIIFGGLADWSFLFFPVSMAFVSYFLETRAQRGWVKLFLIILAVISFIIFISYSLWLVGVSQGTVRLKQALMSRMMLPEEGLAQYVKLLLQRLFHLNTPVLLALFTGFLLTIRQGSSKNILIYALIGGNVLFIVLFPQQIWEHDYLLYYFTPSFAIGSGVFGARLLSLSKAGSKAKYLATFIFLLSIAIFTVLSFKELQALRAMKDDYDEKWVKLGKTINELTKPDEAVVICVERFGPFTEFYADRYIVWGVKGYDELQKALLANKGRHFKYYICNKNSSLNWSKVKPFVFDGWIFIDLQM